jgi:CO/xanthine dehydrogenase FAD-binding subunit
MTISSMYNVDAGLKWISPNGKAEISLEEFYKLKYCSTVVYMVPRA